MKGDIRFWTLVNVMFAVAILVLAGSYSELHQNELGRCQKCTLKWRVVPEHDVSGNTTAACLWAGTHPSNTLTCQHRFLRVTRTAWCQQEFLRRMQGYIMEPMILTVGKMVARGRMKLSDALLTRSVDEMKRRSDELKVCIS